MSKKISTRKRKITMSAMKIRAMSAMKITRMKSFVTISGGMTVRTSINYTGRMKMTKMKVETCSPRSSRRRKKRISP